MVSQGFHASPIRVRWKRQGRGGRTPCRSPRSPLGSRREPSARTDQRTLCRPAGSLPRLLLPNRPGGCWPLGSQLGSLGHRDETSSASSLPFLLHAAKRRSLLRFRISTSEFPANLEGKQPKRGGGWQIKMALKLYTLPNPRTCFHSTPFPSAISEAVDG